MKNGRTLIMKVRLVSSQCLQFRTEQAQDLKKIEKLNQLFFALAVHGEDTNVGRWRA
jgi:signal recognition particle subunit SRP9